MKNIINECEQWKYKIQTAANSWELKWYKENFKFERKKKWKAI